MIAGVIMAHPKRAAWAEELSENLGLPIVWDQVDDRHETGLRCLQAGLGSDATHFCVIQDDAIACRDLLEGIEKATAFSEDRLVGLYVGNVRPHAKTVGPKVEAAQRSGRSWISMTGPLWGVGLVIPTVHLPELVAYYRKSQEQNYDRRIERWATAAKVECWYTIPSLVDHRSGEENPSLVPNRPSLTRRARSFVGVDASPLEIDWSLTPEPSPCEKGTAVPGARMFFRNTRDGRVTKVRAGSAMARRCESLDSWEPVIEHRCETCDGRGRWYEPAVAPASEHV